MLAEHPELNLEGKSLITKERLRASEGYRQTLKDFILLVSGDENISFNQVIEYASGDNHWTNDEGEVVDDELSKKIFLEDVTKIFVDQKKFAAFQRSLKKELGNFSGQEKESLRNSIALHGDIDFGAIFRAIDAGQYPKTPLLRAAVLLNLPEKLNPAVSEDLLDTIDGAESREGESQVNPVSLVQSLANAVLTELAESGVNKLNKEVISAKVDELLGQISSDEELVVKQLQTLQELFGVSGNVDVKKLFDLFTEILLEPKIQELEAVLTKDAEQNIFHELQNLSIDPATRSIISDPEFFDVPEISSELFIARFRLAVHEKIIPMIKDGFPESQAIRMLGFLGYVEEDEKEVVPPAPTPDEEAQALAANLVVNVEKQSPPIEIPTVSKHKHELPEQNRVLLESEIPGVDKLMNVWVEVVDGNIHIPDRVLVGSQKKSKREIAVRFEIEGAQDGTCKLHDGEYLLTFNLLSKNLKNGEQRIVLEYSPFSFEVEDVVRPVSYNSIDKEYILSDGSVAVRSRVAGYSKFVDPQTGVYEDGSFPTLRIKKIREEGRGLQKFYIAEAVSPRELELGVTLDQVLAEHHVRFAGSFANSVHQPFFHGAIPEVQRMQVIKDLREATKTNPIDVVVSMSGTQMKRGFLAFSQKLQQVLSQHPELEYLKEAQKKSFRTYEIFSSSTEENIAKTKADGFWDDHISFMRALHDPAVSAAFEMPDVRQVFFPSDIDGEVACELLRVAGVTVRVVPFTPNNRKHKEEYIRGAWHVDINHQDAGIHEMEDGGMGVFLDEGWESSFSATTATHRFLGQLGFLDQMHKPEARLFEYLLRFVSEEDSFTGPYKTKKGCADVFNNYPYSIFGVGKLMIEEGRFSEVLKFFTDTIPKFEEEVIESFKQDNRKFSYEELQSEVLYKFVRYHVQEYFGESVNKVVNDLKNRREKSVFLVNNIQQLGCTGQTRFGRTLFDFTSAVPHRGFAAFAAGYDCYVGYNPQGKMCVVNIAPFAPEKVRLPGDFLSTDGEQHGKNIKDNRYYVMNASSRKLSGLNQLLGELFISKGGHQYKVPPGVERFAGLSDVEEYKKALQTGYYEKDKNKFFEDDIRNIGKSLFELQQVILSSSDRVELSKARNQVTDLYLGIVETISFKKVPKELYEKLRSDIYEFIVGDLRLALYRAHTIFTGDAFAKKVTDPERFAEELLRLTANDLGLIGYRKIIKADKPDKSESFDEIVKKEWKDKLLAAWSK